MKRLSVEHESMLEALTHCFVPPHPDALQPIRESAAAALAVIREADAPSAGHGTQPQVDIVDALLEWEGALHQWRHRPFEGIKTTQQRYARVEAAIETLRAALASR